MEYLVMRYGGVDAYNDWVSHEVPFNDDTVKEAGEYFEDAMLASFISRPSTFLPRNSGVRRSRKIQTRTPAGVRAPLLTAWVGAVSTCLTGPTNALLSASGERSRQYTAGLVCGLLAQIYGWHVGFGAAGGVGASSRIISAATTQHSASTTNSERSSPSCTA